MGKGHRLIAHRDIQFGVGQLRDQTIRRLIRAVGHGGDGAAGNVLHIRHLRLKISQLVTHRWIIDSG